jgi:sugar lactone lactonase YvrE
VLAYLLAWPSPIDAIELPSRPPPSWSDNDRLSAAVAIASVGEGPEDVAVAEDGAIFTGLFDGRIVRVDGAGVATTCAQTGGRPLGLHFDRDGALWVADAYRGLLRVDAHGEVEVVIDRVDGEPMLFADELDLAGDGSVWLTDASQRFAIDRVVEDALEGRATGRLLRCDPVAGTAEVWADGLHFANGVALAADERSIFVSETFGYRVVRVWIDGPRARERDVVLEDLPGLPDNLARGDDGTLWVAFATRRSGLLDRLGPWPYLREVVARIPGPLRPLPPDHGFVLGFAEDGTIRADLQDPSGRWRGLTSAVPVGSELVLGSLHGTELGRLAIP